MKRQQEEYALRLLHRVRCMESISTEDSIVQIWLLSTDDSIVYLCLLSTEDSIVYLWLLSTEDSTWHL